MMIKVYPAILSNDIEDFKSKLRQVYFARIIQVDVLDGKFVKNKSLMAKDLKKIKVKKKIEFHLMIRNPERYIDEYMNLNPYSIVFHVESTTKVNELINTIRSRNIKVGIAINPETRIEKIIPYLFKIDSVLIMTVHPGYYGSKFIKSALEKIRTIRTKTKIPIEVDGHIDNKTKELVRKAGANILVSGSYIFKNDPVKSYKNLLK